MEELFEQAYGRMMEKAIKNARGERRRKIKEDHGYLEKLFLEKVWWPAVGNLKFLHPEYEVRDFKDGTRFCDFAYLPPRGSGMLIEADGFGTHFRDVSRWKYGDDMERQNHLLIDGWNLLRFTRDYMLERPRQCQQTLLLGLAKWSGASDKEDIPLNVYERAILHLAAERPDELTPVFTARKLAINRKTATANLRSLADKDLLAPVHSANGRTMRYVPVNSVPYSRKFFRRKDEK
ncbi:DNA-binding response regulator [Cohnella laeviribosi]|uniref:DNA-binding response regulator n=1 Tax=Cohnella laeviribosi TaxID=380174 RepID=UPI003D24B7AD